MRVNFGESNRFQLGGSGTGIPHPSGMPAELKAEGLASWATRSGCLPERVAGCLSRRSPKDSLRWAGGVRSGRAKRDNGGSTRFDGSAVHRTVSVDGTSIAASSRRRSSARPRGSALSPATAPAASERGPPTVLLKPSSVLMCQGRWPPGRRRGKIRDRLQGQRSSTSAISLVIFAESMLPFASSRVTISVPFSLPPSSCGKMPWVRYQASFSSHRRR